MIQECNRSRTLTIAAIAGGLFATLAASAQYAPPSIESRETTKVYIERPPRTIAIVSGVNVTSETLELYRDANFSDQKASLTVTAHAAGQAQELPNGLEDSLSSLRWNLPPGVLVVFYEDDGAKGEQLAIWGSGQIDQLSTFDFDNKASQYAWYYVGGAQEPSEVIVRGAAIPVGSVTMSSTVPVPQNSLQLFKSKDFSANTVTLNPLAQAANTLHRLPEDLPDSLTSMRWNLPPGVVLMFHQDADGTKQQVAIWGSGQVSDLDVWDFNDKASRWAWHYIGSPDVEVVGYTPPTDNDVDIVVVGAEKDSIDLVARAMVPTELKLDPNALRAKKNPVGEGTFVYAPQTNFNGVERHVIWLAHDDAAYAMTGAASLVTPTLKTPSSANDAAWNRTGINKNMAEQDAIKIVFATQP